ncbi:MAG: SGNH/GDSL hydrolase family protein [Lachnospiraceae bacterium]|nr:SGNH/GDSL hydrolase family protein [Lachnospiraceae bacterium]
MAEKNLTVLCYGDSNTFGYIPNSAMRYSRDVRWTGRLQMLLGKEYSIIEEGCSGRTTIYDDPMEGWKNGLDYLKPCLNSHKPVDIVILMLGTNDLKDTFHTDAADAAAGVEKLIQVINSFTMEKQGFVPRIILVSPPEIGEGIRTSDFYGAFLDDSVEKSKHFPEYYKPVAERNNCLFFNAAEYVKPSKEDSLHLTPEGHAVLAEKLAEIVRNIVEAGEI